MNDYKHRKTSRLTATSLALAAILTVGAGTGWAQSQNATPSGGKNAPGEEVVVNGVTSTTTLTGAFTAKDLKMGTGDKVTDLQINAAVALTGNGSGNLISNADGSAVPLVQVLGTNTLTLGNTVANTSSSQGGSLQTVVLATGATLEVNQGRFNIQTLTGGTVSLDPAFDNTGKYNPNNVGILAAANVGGANGQTLMSLVEIGQDSHMTIGKADSGAFAQSVIQNIEDNSTLRWTNIASVATDNQMTAGLAVTKALTIADTTGGIAVDGQNVTAPTATGGNVAFAANSLLIVDSAQMANGATVFANTIASNTNTFTVGDDATLYIANAKVNGGNEQGTLNMYGGFGGSNTISTTAGHEAWNGKHLQYDTRLITGTTAPLTGIVTNHYLGAASAQNADGQGGFAAGKISGGMARAIDGVFLNGYNDFNSADAGVKFISRAVSSLYLDTTMNNDTQVVTTLEGAAAMASTAGVQTAAYSISNTVADNYNARLSYLRDTAPAAGSEPGSVGIWVNPFYNYSDVDGVSIGRHNTGYEINYGGATIGVDTNVNESVRLGVAFSVGGGDTESQGHKFNRTDSDFDFWGVGLYGSYTNGAFGLTGDFGYTSGSYDLDQRLPALLGMGKLTSNVDTDTYTVGLTGEYRFTTANCLNIIPHLGVRYTGLDTDGYRVKSKGEGTVYRVKSESQDIWSFPVGVTFTGDLDTSSGWVIKPKADLGVIFATGDLDADNRFRVGETGVTGNVMANDVVDPVTFNGLVGIKADAGNGFSVGLDYNFKASDNLTSHGVVGTMRFEF